MTEDAEITFELARQIASHEKLAMAWRNDPVTRAMSFHQEGSFQTYFGGANFPPLFALKDGVRIGFLRFREINLEPSRIACEVGINMAPEFRGKGLGAVVLKALKLAVDDLYAEVREENGASHQIFLKAGFRLLEKTIKVVEDTKEECAIRRYILPLTPIISPRVFVIAEAGSNWRMGTPERDLAMAKALISVAKEAGADAIKFQTYRAEAVYVQNAGAISSVFADLEMPYDMIPELAKECKRVGIPFMSTPFSKADFLALDPYVSIHKIASYEISHPTLIELAARSGKRVILSTGASTLEEIEWAINLFHECGGKDLTLLQCTARYPADLSSMHLHTIPFLKRCFGLPVGLSDHSRDPVIAPVAAVALGACVIEKHFTLDNRLPGPDHAFALTADELKTMIEAIRETEKTLGDRVKKVDPSEEELRQFAKRALQAIRPIKKGERFHEGVNVSVLRPGDQSKGVHPKHLKEIEGKAATRDIPLGSGIQQGDW